MKIKINVIHSFLRKKRQLKNVLHYLCAISLVVCFFSGFTAYANEAPKTHVKVGLPIQEGTSYINANGDYAGYLVDYLKQLSLFVDWEIEFVQADGDLDTQLETLMAMLQTGEIDMLGTMNRSTQLEEMFLYPNYSYGTSYTTLATRKDDPEWIEEDFSRWDGIRVATFPGFQDQLSDFVYYATVNDFTYEVIYCDSYSDMIQAVENGEADAMLQSDISIGDDFRIIGRFSPDPYYFALSPNNTELLKQLNVAMRSLDSSQPNLQTELYNLHFRYMDDFQLSAEYKECIDSLGTVKVLFFNGDAPFQYVKDGELTGFSVEYFEKFAEITGLQYEVVMANTYAEAFSMIGNGEVDLVACVATNSSLASLDNVKFTIPYFNSFSVTVCSNPEPHKHEDNLEFRMNTELALSQIQDKEKDGIRADYYALSYYLRKENIYDNVVVDWANTQNFSYTVGVTNKIPNEFIALLNQYASSFSNETKQTMLYKYSADPAQYTLGEWLFIHRTVLILSLGIGCAILVVFVLHLRSKHLERKALAAENKLVHLSMYDAMTGAYNEVQFRKLLQECCDNKENIAVVAFNIRGFKYINDTYGNKRADDLLCEIKVILELEIQKGEFFCRPSADLFYLALKEPDAKHLLSRINSIFSKIVASTAILLDGHPLSLYSGAVFVGDSPTPYRVSPNMSYVMTAMAHAKLINRQDTYIFDQSLYQKEQLHYYIETHMKAALENGEYKLYLQPKMNLQTGCIDGAEALVRWQPLDRGMIYPDQFIPFFEENGFCASLDLYMIEQVCKTLRTWINTGIAPVVISVNQTKALFVRDDYVESLLAITDKYHISPRYIILEILEGLAFENIESLNNTIQKLNHAGFRVSMDDFGSGYSSLNTLGKIEINELKLDREFLMNVVNDPTGSQSVVLASILGLARKLGISTVAEGVETKENEDMIRSMCCDYGQGYYYSKPVPAETFREEFCTLEGKIFEK